MSSTPYLLAATDPAWRNDADYDAGALKYHNGKIYKALQASGPHRGGVRTPGDNSAYWVELAEVDDSRLVHTSGNEIINGDKVFNYSAIDIREPKYISTEDPSENAYWNIQMTDGNGRLVGDILLFHNTEANGGDSGFEFRILSHDNESLSNTANLGVFYDDELSEPYALGPSTRSVPHDRELVTVDYLKKYVADALAVLQPQQT